MAAFLDLPALATELKKRVSLSMERAERKGRGTTRMMLMKDRGEMNLFEMVMWRKEG